MVLVQDLDEQLKNELTKALADCVRDVNTFIEPLQKQSELVVSQIAALQSRQNELMEELSGIQREAANIE